MIFLSHCIFFVSTFLDYYKAKSGGDKSAPSFKRYISDHHPEHALRFSKCGYRKDGEITNIPLYLAGKTKALL